MGDKLSPRKSDLDAKVLVPFHPGKLKPITSRLEELKPKTPEEDPAVAAMRDQQAREIAELDDEENRRIKTLLLATRGVRMYRGSPLQRAAPGNFAGGGRSSGGAASGGGGSLLPAYSGGGGGSGAGGGGGRGGRRTNALTN